MPVLYMGRKRERERSTCTSIIWPISAQAFFKKKTGKGREQESIGQFGKDTQERIARTGYDRKDRRQDGRVGFQTRKAGYRRMLTGDTHQEGQFKQEILKRQDRTVGGGTDKNKNR